MSRAVPPPAGDELTLLSSFLDRYRATPATKCAGLAEEPAHRRAPASSPAMSMAGPVGRQRGVMLHMIEKTARHVGRLDVMRELLDGAGSP